MKGPEKPGLFCFQGKAYIGLRVPDVAGAVQDREAPGK